MDQDTVLITPRSSRAIRIALLFLALLLGCSGSNDGQEARDQNAGPTDAVTGEPNQSLVHPDELFAYLDSPFLLTYLGIDQAIVLEVRVDKAVIGAAGTDEPLGEVYYTIQDGWHLKRENERMEFKPGQGWLIWEQESSVRYPNTTEWVKSDDGVLSLRISSDKSEYVSGETIEVVLELRNLSNTAVKAESVTYALGTYGNALSVQGPVELQYFGPWKEYHVPPSVILPGEITSDTTTLSVIHWHGLDAAGEYRLKCVYQSGDVTEDDGMWTGRIPSGSLKVNVKPKQ
jgi:hypothetical protein